MYIKKLDIKGFGKLKNTSIKLDKGLNIVYGNNESGKTTLQWFIKAMLYGLKGGRALKDGVLPPLKKFRPWTGSAYRGSLEYSLDDGSSFRVDRDFDRNTVDIFDASFNNISSSFDAGKDKGLLFADRQLGINDMCFEKTVLVKQMETRLDDDGSDELLNRLVNLSQTGFEDLSFKRAEEALKNAIKNQVGTDRTTTQPLDRITARLSELSRLKERVAEKLHLETAREGKLLEALSEKDRLLKKKVYLTKVMGLIGYRKQLDTDRIKLKALAEAQTAVKKLELELAKASAIKEQLLGKSYEDIIPKRARKPKGPKGTGRSQVLVFIALLVLIAVSTIAAVLWNPVGYLSTAVFIVAGIVFGLFTFIRRNGQDQVAVLEPEQAIRQEYEQRLLEVKALNEELMDISNKASAICGRQLENSGDMDSEIYKLSKSLDENEMKLQGGIDALSSPDIDMESSFFKPSGLGEVLVDSNPTWLSESWDYEMEKANTDITENALRVKEYETLLAEPYENGYTLQGIEEELAELEARKLELDRTGSSLRMALEELTKASLEIRKSYAPELNFQLSAIAGEITGGRYEDLKADDALSLRTIAPDTGDVRNIKALSGGTIDQMYLALRLSMAGLITKGFESLPLILDEAFSQFDDERTIQTLKYLSEKYKDGQVILFTCKARELDLAREVCSGRLNLVEL